MLVIAARAGAGRNPPGGGGKRSSRARRYSGIDVRLIGVRIPVRAKGQAMDTTRWRRLGAGVLAVALAGTVWLAATPA